jgi:acetolactate decarboxylase
MKKLHSVLLVILSFASPARGADLYRTLDDLDLRVFACTPNPEPFVIASREDLLAKLRALSPHCRPAVFDELSASFLASLDRAHLDWSSHSLVVVQDWYGTSMVDAHLALSASPAAGVVHAQIVWKPAPPPVTPDTTVRRFAFAVDRTAIANVHVHGKKDRVRVLGTSGTTGEHRRPSWNGEIEVHGTLRAIFHDDRTAAAVHLDALLPDPHLYAVGALADLAGEITIVGGTVHLSHPIDDDRAVHEIVAKTNAGAALLVATSVPAWRDLGALPETIPWSSLDDGLVRFLAEAGLDMSTRIPLLLEGEFDDLHWHVIDGRRLEGGGGSYEQHMAASSKGTFERTRAVLVGFYSPHDQGIFTHRASRTHLHCVIEDPLVTGHVDRVTPLAGTLVRVPVMGEPGDR